MDGLAPGLRVFGSAHRYVQGVGALDAVGPLIASLGDHATVMIDRPMVAVLGDRLRASIEGAGLGLEVVPLEGDVTHTNIEAMSARVAGVGRPTIVVAVGGGKALDLARAASWHQRATFVTIPTIASNDSPAAMAVAVYDDDHALVEVIQTGRNPEIVLVDPAVIAGAPARFLSAGIGDAIAKKFEAESCRAAGGNTQHGAPSLRVAGAIADACYETLRASAVDGVAAVARGEVDQSLEDTIEAVVLMAGLAFENGGLSIAHSMMRGLQVVRGTRSRMHGEHVAYGLLVHRALEGVDDAELGDLADFLVAVGLPDSLRALDLPDPSEAELVELADRCVGSPHRHKTLAHVDRSSVLAAMRRVEEFRGM